MIGNNASKCLSSLLSAIQLREDSAQAFDSLALALGQSIEFQPRSWSEYGRTCTYSPCMSAHTHLFAHLRRAPRTSPWRIRSWMAASLARAWPLGSRGVCRSGLLAGQVGRLHALHVRIQCSMDVERERGLLALALAKGS